MRDLLLAICFLAVSSSAAPGQDSPVGEQWFERLEAGKIAELEQQIQKAHAAVAPSVVRIRTMKKDHECSGVIIDENGLILTCAHHEIPPGCEVTVELADRREFKGITLGFFKAPTQSSQQRAHDIGLIRIQGEGEWPAVSFGKPYRLRNGEACLVLGSPRGHEPGQPPLLRLGRILPPVGYGQVRSSCRIAPGDSGGPLFNLRGELLGVLSHSYGYQWAGAEYTSIDVFAALRDRLLKGDEIEEFHPKLGRPFDAPHDAFGAFEPAEEVIDLAKASRKSVVQVLSDGKCVAFGLLVDADGLVVTKRTELAGAKKITCQLADGRVLEADVFGLSRDHDLAILKIAAVDLPTPVWADEGGVAVGQLVACGGMELGNLKLGVVGGVKVANPATRGELPIAGKPAPKGVAGVVFTEFWKDRVDIGELGQQLQPGDLITHLDGVPTNTPAIYHAVHMLRMAASKAMIGERVDLTVVRGESIRHAFAPITPSGTISKLFWEQSPWSLRRNGFPDVFAHDAGIPPNQCGGPVFDRLGRVVGINIARADHVRVFAIPMSVVHKVVAEIKANR